MSKIYKDNRVSEVVKIVTALYNSTMYNNISVLVLADTLILNVNETLLYFIHLNTNQDDVNNPINFAFNFGAVYNSSTANDSNYYIMDNIIGNRMMNLYNYYNYYNSVHPLYVVDDLRNDEKFEEILGKKSADGLSMYMLDGGKYILNWFTGLITINSADKIGVSIYQELNTRNLVLKYHVFKKKINRYMDIYLRSINL